MNIIEKRGNEKEFENICIGECFKYGKNYYLKIEEIALGCMSVNAVNLYDGITEEFDNLENVIPVSADLRISF